MNASRPVNGHPAACAGWVLALAALAAPARGEATFPDVPRIQAAYEAAYLANRGKPPGEHADDLVIQTARCQPLKTSSTGAACQIDFVRQREPEGRLYFDIVTLEPRAEGSWALLSGLCMTKPADKHAQAARGTLR
ncbi:hypothetical protein [Ideonella sp.]|uniref:hypothetical protein n=1 Tax=Ideonella sp. TaxID=1929293 RepID=UPI0035B27B17